MILIDRDYPLLVGTTMKTTSRNLAPSEPATITRHEQPVTDSGDWEAEKSFEENDREEASSPAVGSSMGASESIVTLRKLVINQPQFTRLVWDFLHLFAILKFPTLLNSACLKAIAFIFVMEVEEFHLSRQNAVLPTVHASLNLHAAVAGNSRGNHRG